MKNPIECRNCGKEIYFDPPGVRGQPWDLETRELHRCVGGSGYTNSKGKPPSSKPCKFECGTMIVYDTKEGYYREGSITGLRHNCSNLTKETTGQQLLTSTTTPQRGSLEQIAYQPKLNTSGPTELGELLSLIRETNALLLGISEQLKKNADNQDLNNRMTRAIRDILQEYKDEVIDTIKKPPMKFESGNNIESRIIDDDQVVDEDDVNDDIYDEFADVDDKTTTTGQ